MDQPQHTVLDGMARVIGLSLASRPEHFITHPAELKLFHSVSDDDLRAFARDHGWRVVRRIGGHQIEFYNDAEMRLERSRTGDTRP